MNVEDTLNIEEIEKKLLELEEEEPSLTRNKPYIDKILKPLIRGVRKDRERDLCIGREIRGWKNCVNIDIAISTLASIEKVVK